MKYDPNKHHRRSIRLKGYDYSWPGAYFVTVCTHNRDCLFGKIVVGAKHSGKDRMFGFRNRHGNASPLPGRPHGTKSGSLSAIMQNYLSITVRKINQIRNTPGVKLWQRNYHDRIIRNERELNNIRDYIINNPLSWELDKENPKD